MTTEQCFFGGSGPIHYLQAYAEASASLRRCKGCLREHKSSSRCLCGRLRGQMFSSSVEAQVGSSNWKIATFQYKSSFSSSSSKDDLCETIEKPHLLKDLAVRKGVRTLKCFESLSKCLRGAYAEPTRRLQNKRKEGKEANSAILGKHH